ncbi:MAG: pyridoxal-phosphate dependent enzyme [Flavobacteriales bacterium]|nr:pyridoxal-phosphate dependent enzyme [Flavobacteriales bacterium]
MINSEIFDPQEINKAHERIRPYIHQTPVLTSQAIDKIAGCSIHFKCENFQKIGAFKMRGASNAILQLDKTKISAGVVTHSSGNHAQAVAKAAQLIGIPAYIVMPENAPKVKIAAVKDYGGIVSFCEATLVARETTSQKIIEDKTATFIHPYDNKDIIIGQATAAKELIEEVPQLESILCPVGGGGLLAGTILSAQFFSNNCKIYGTEPKGADDAYQSFKQRKLIPQISPNTIADGLLTSLGKINYEIIKDQVSDILLVNDREIKEAMRLIWERMKTIIEPSSAVPLAALLRNKALFKDQKVGIILSGGNVDLKKILSLL